MIRPRRWRRSGALRALVSETDLAVEQLVQPVFVRAGSGSSRPIRSMPGHAQLSPDLAADEVARAVDLGLRAFILFGIPEAKDRDGSAASNAGGPVPTALAMIRRRLPDVVLVADVCLCEYTSHGHCGVLTDSGTVDNDTTLPALARAGVTYADAGATIVAPSAMMDGQVRALRAALDLAGHHETAVLSYAVKYASAFYGPFREAAESTPAAGDRRGYQMDPPNMREALREAALDESEGADGLMVKPAGPYLDIVRAVRDRFDLPLAAFQVSGEYAMIKAAGQMGWLDERRAALESLIGIRRAGADFILTYFAREAAGWLRDGGDAS